VLVLRERKNLFAAKALKFFTGVPIVSELHEGGLPCNENKKQRARIQTLFNSVDGVIFTNRSQIQYLNEHGYQLPKMHIVLPNGVDTQKFSQAISTPRDATQLIVTYTGQFTSWKNMPLLFDSMRQLPPNFRLRIAGGKSRGEDSNSYIHKLEKEFGVEGRVEYLGFLHPSELISRAINGSSVLAVPLGENLTAKFATSPMKLVEYMATSIPIVAVAYPSVTHLTGDNTVHLSQMGAKEFSDAIRVAIEEDSELRQQRIHRTNLIAKQYDHVERAGKYDRWLHEIGKKGSHSPRC
jgi:glycosyltransferase involved in cell wall biosynthesis